ncbi:MAG: heme biosynthesis HemY N-terminal domain-containing protein [Pseudomonadota bacterium]
MRAAIWLVTLFAVAVAIALFAGNNQAVVTLFWPPHRVDISFNLAVLLLAGLIALVHLALRAMAAVFSLPLQARRWRAQQKERAMYAAFMDGISHLTAGRFIRASRSAENALQQESGLRVLAQEIHHDTGHNPARSVQLRALAHLLAAESAQSLQNRTLRDSHLEQALTPAGPAFTVETGEGIQLRAAHWALQDRDPGAAIGLLNQLPQGASRRTLALRLKLRATRQAGLTQDALETARLLAKHRAFSPQAAQSILRGLGMELLNGAHDSEQMQRAWHALDDAERAMPELAIHAANRLMAVQGEAELARQWLLGVWDTVMAPQAGLGSNIRVKLVCALESGLASIDAAWLARIEAALQSSPRDANLQYLAGMACLNRQLWGKAQQLLSQAALALQDVSLRRKAWRAVAQLAEERGDEAAANAAFRRAAEA